MTLAFIHEIEELADEFAAALFFVKLDRFQGRAVHLDEAIAPRDLAPFVEDIIPRRAIGRIEVAETGKSLHGKLDRGGFRRGAPNVLPPLCRRKQS